MIRAHFTNGADQESLYCRLIAANGNYMTRLGSALTTVSADGSVSPFRWLQRVGIAQVGT